MPKKLLERLAALEGDEELGASGEEGLDEGGQPGSGEAAAAEEAEAASPSGRGEEQDEQWRQFDAMLEGWLVRHGRRCCCFALQGRAPGCGRSGLGAGAAGAPAGPPLSCPNLSSPPGREPLHGYSLELAATACAAPTGATAGRGALLLGGRGRRPPRALCALLLPAPLWVSRCWGLLPSGGVPGGGVGLAGPAVAMR